MAKLIVTLVPVRLSAKTRMTKAGRRAQVIEPVVAELIAELEEAGKTTYAIQKELNERAKTDPTFRPARRGEQWYWSTVNAVLKSDWFSRLRDERNYARGDTKT